MKSVFARPTVHVVDDDDAVRDAMGELLLAAGYAAETYPSAEAFLERLGPRVSGCVITDVRMAPIDGLELLRRVRQQQPGLPCIVLTGQADVPMAVQALKDGARDFIEKPIDERTLLASVEAALVEADRRGARESLRADVRRRMDKLSARERDVLDGLVEGLSNKELALNLGISPRTVEAYRANVMNKLQAESLSDLVRLALLVED